MKAQFKLRIQTMPRIEAFIPMPNQYLFCCSKAKEKCLFGGNQSGKTTCASWNVAVYASGRYPNWFPSASKFVTGDQIKVRLLAHDIKDIIEQIMKPNLDYWFNDFDPIKWRSKHGSLAWGETTSGSAVFSATCEKQDLKHAEGWVGHLVYLDEPIKEPYYTASLRGLLKHHGRALVCMTPLDCDWIDEKFEHKATSLEGDEYEKPFAVSLDTLSNLYLDYDERRYFADELARRDYREYLRRVKGLSPNILDRAIKSFGPENIIPPQKFNRASYYMALDPHGAKGDALLWMAVLKPLAGYTPAYVVISEHFEPEKYWTLAELADFIRRHEEGLGIAGKVVARYIDPRYCQHKQKFSGLTFVDELSRVSASAGYPITFAPAVVEPITTGLARLGQLCAQDTLIPGSPFPTFGKQLLVFHNCPKTIAALEKARFQDGKMIDNHHKDLCDCLRYLTGYHPVYIDSQANTTQEEDEKPLLEIDDIF